MNPFVATAQQRRLVLASTSPRRATVLQMLGFEFDTAAAPIDEAALGLPDPEPHVVRLAELKARAAAPAWPDRVLIGADTVVAIDDAILEKPRSAAEALVMLQRLRGRWHTVFTGLALLDGPAHRMIAAAERTEVRFARWDDAALQRYVASGECMDKAGAYAIQGMGALLVEEIRGCFYNVMGFPIGTFARLLADLHDSEAKHGR